MLCWAYDADMSPRHPMAALKETANQKIREIIVGNAANVVARSVMRNLEANGEAGIVLIKRTKQQGWPGHFMPAVGSLVEQMLYDSGTDLHFDARASKDTSQMLTEHGYGNPRISDWRNDVVAFVFRQPAMAEIIQLEPLISEETAHLARAA